MDTQLLTTIGGPVPGDDAFEAATEALAELEDRKRALEDEGRELESTEAELLEESGDRRSEGRDASDLRERILEVRARRDQVEAGLDKLGPKLDEARRVREKAAEVCYRNEAERLREEGLSALEAMLERVHEAIDAFEVWYGGPGVMGERDRFIRCARRADQTVADPKLQLEGLQRGELAAITSALDELSEKRGTWRENERREAENEDAA